MSEFTAGPWSAFIVDSTISIDIGETPNGSRPNIVQWVGFDGCDLPLEECKANALLIAAAPDMYAELKKVMSGLTDYEAIKSVLAKAEGKS